MTTPTHSEVVQPQANAEQQADPQQHLGLIAPIVGTQTNTQPPQANWVKVTTRCISFLVLAGSLVASDRLYMPLSSSSTVVEIFYKMIYLSLLVSSISIHKHYSIGTDTYKYSMLIVYIIGPLTLVFPTMIADSPGSSTSPTPPSPALDRVLAILGSGAVYLLKICVVPFILMGMQIFTVIYLVEGEIWLRSCLRSCIP
ncbi:hypothetical protein E1B28_010909 [Marasmius oreades]|uniref:Uncharacterized protein n=1 Tax=Marasmius oreades TaxID=181124 RepID=A0A9P7UNZ6_9AGAR|nr:uncharacterized protein E1B28_010909 [Marasmius oreades]KAG7089207.1 hypothetical protein E1B28_010909 [Marasmius oreades]